MRHLALYIPGLGGHYDKGRSFLLKSWRLWGIEARLLPVLWYGNESYEQKLGDIRHAVKDAMREGYTVTLIGESAGASLALNAAAELHDLHRIILIAGVNSSSLPISPKLQARSPMLVRSSSNIAESLKKLDPKKIHTVRALRDSVAWPRYDTIPGATSHILFAFGHFPTIVLCLSVLSGFVARLMTRK